MVVSERNKKGWKDFSLVLKWYARSLCLVNCDSIWMVQLSVNQSGEWVFHLNDHKIPTLFHPAKHDLNKNAIETDISFDYLICFVLFLLYHSLLPSSKSYGFMTACPYQLCIQLSVSCLSCQSPFKCQLRKVSHIYIIFHCRAPIQMISVALNQIKVSRPITFHLVQIQRKC